MGGGEEMTPAHHDAEEFQTGTSQSICDGIGTTKGPSETAAVFSEDGVANRRRGPGLSLNDANKGGSRRLLAREGRGHETKTLGD